jgi:uncharacterized membrane protein
MADLIVIAFDDETTAGRLKDDLGQLQKEELIGLDDVVVVVRHEDGKIKIKQAVNLVGAGALSGSFWGLFIGILFWMPWLGLAIGAASGALGGKLSDIGIDDDFIKETSESIDPGSSAIFLLVRKSTPDKVAQRLEGYHGKVIQTSLTDEQEAKLRESFGGGSDE